MRREPAVFFANARQTGGRNIWHKLNVTGGKISLMLEIQRQIETAERRGQVVKNRTRGLM
jgi:hypothetical protein